MAAPRHFLAERASATAADVQVFVERFIQLLLLGIEYRHILLLNLFRRRTGGNCWARGCKWPIGALPYTVVPGPPMEAALPTALPQNKRADVGFH